MALTQHERSRVLNEHSRCLADLKSGQRSLEEGFAEVKELLIRALER